MEQKNKLCPHCKTEVNKEATRCPHCHGKIYRWTTGRKVLAGLFSFLIIVLILGSSDDKSSSDSSTVAQEKYTDTTVCIEAQLLIEKTLKSPATADFPTCSYFSIERLDNDGFEVSSYVDSQNGFGALIRSNWTIKFYYVGDMTRTDLVIVDGETVYTR